MKHTLHLCLTALGLLFVAAFIVLICGYSAVTFGYYDPPSEFVLYTYAVGYLGYAFMGLVLSIRWTQAMMAHAYLDLLREAR